MYSAAAASENYLRGAQETDAAGTVTVTFTTIFPACYSGRWPHIHFEVYPSLAMASSGANKVATSQLVLLEEGCAAVFASEGYEASSANLAQIRWIPTMSSVTASSSNCPRCAAAWPMVSSPS